MPYTSMSVRTVAIAVLATLAASTRADDWPQWLGPQRDGLWRETGILGTFPESGPTLRWRADIGGGYAGPSVADGRVFVPDFIRDEDKPPVFLEHGAPNENWQRARGAGTERLLCLYEADGEVLWTFEHAVTYTHARLYANGPRMTPHVDGDRVYFLGAEG
ncbi:MAG TPA: PQQ-binding-like beta-propeller repeat protein, partial [Armatimonadota bacterium]|nr:PQQ-binding-like beta-propeller repeat protein [Armatimonadota bacterium]